MVELRIEPADAARFADVQATFTGGGDGDACQCQWWMLRSVDYRRITPAERGELLRHELDAATPPGLVAYVDDEPAGWVRVGPRPTHARIPHNRGIRVATRERLDAPDVWAVSCFSVRREHRGSGLVRMLLAAAVEFAAEHGARVLESYAVDTAGGHVNPNDLFRGAVSTFEAAGFVRVAPIGQHRVLMERSIASPAQTRITR